MAVYREWIEKAPWFAESTPASAKAASIEIGTGDNGKVTVSCDKNGAEGNDYSLEVVLASGNSAPLAAALSGKKITVTLGTGAGGAADNTKNTAKLIAGAIDGISGFTAVYSGTGATAISAAVSEDEFEGGQDGTACPEGNTIIKGTSYYYVCTKPGDAGSVEWKRFTLATY